MEGIENNQKRKMLECGCALIIILTLLGGALRSMTKEHNGINPFLLFYFSSVCLRTVLFFKKMSRSMHSFMRESVMATTGHLICHRLPQLIIAPPKSRPLQVDSELGEHELKRVSWLTWVEASGPFPQYQITLRHSPTSQGRQGSMGFSTFISFLFSFGVRNYTDFV